MGPINIYIGNLSYQTTETDLSVLFNTFGQVVKATIVTDREQGRPKGFGFVEMADRDAGQRAISALAGQAFQGRPLTVNEARPRGSGSGERVLGDGTGSGTEAPAANDGNRMAPPIHTDESTTVGGSVGYSNTLLRR